MYNGNYEVASLVYIYMYMYVQKRYFPLCCQAEYSEKMYRPRGGPRVTRNSHNSYNAFFSLKIKSECKSMFDSSA